MVRHSIRPTRIWIYSFAPKCSFKSVQHAGELWSLRDYTAPSPQSSMSRSVFRKNKKNRVLRLPSFRRDALHKAHGPAVAYPLALCPNHAIDRSMRLSNSSVRRVRRFRPSIDPANLRKQFSTKLCKRIWKRYWPKLNSTASTALGIQNSSRKSSVAT